MEKVPYTNLIKFIGLDDLVPNNLDRTKLPFGSNWPIMVPYRNGEMYKWYHMEKVPYKNVIRLIAMDDLVPNYLDPTDLSWYHIKMVPYRKGTI